MAGGDRLEGVRQQVGQVLYDLHGLLGRVSFQASLAPDERDVLADLVFGTIVWSKDLGRPSTSSLFEGFSVQHQWEKIEIDSGPAGEVEHRTWVADPPPYSAMALTTKRVIASASWIKCSDKPVS